MSFKFSGKINVTDTDDLLDQIKNFAVAAGWTLHDDLSSSSPRAYVLSSEGESGLEMTAYIKFYQATNMIKMSLCAYWNAVTHAETYKCGSLSVYNRLNADDDASFDAYISVNKDSIVAASFVSSKWNALAVGLLDIYTDTANGQLQDAVTAGSSKVLQLGTDEAATFKVGGNYQIFGQNYRQWVQVSAVDAGSDQITLTTLSYAMEAGARIGNTPHRWFLIATEYYYAFRFKYNTNGNADDTTQMSAVQWNFINGMYTDPNPRGGADDMYVIAPVEITDYNCLAGIPKESFLLGKIDLNTTSNEHIVTVNDLDAGTSTGSNTSTTLNDTGKSWTTDEFDGKAVAIVAGTGSGQMNIVASNTATELTVENAWAVTPDATSEYVLADEAWISFYFNNSANYYGVIRGA
jgi:hypothetical protein